VQESLGVVLGAGFIPTWRSQQEALRWRPAPAQTVPLGADIWMDFSQEN